MAKADFYILTTASGRERCLFACQLIEKIYRSGLFCYVLTDSEQQNRTLDEMLWTFRDNSFIPHQLYTGQAPAHQQTVLIGLLPPPPAWQQVVLNLSNQPPSDLNQIQRVLEIMDNREEVKARGRLRYRYYQQHQFEMNSHQL